MVAWVFIFWATKNIEINIGVGLYLSLDLSIFNLISHNFLCREIQNMPTTSTETINFICDKASACDEFGIHTRIAKAIEKIVDSNQEVRTIGLIGSWGSGKSTILKILLENLEKKDRKHILFIFDSWAHQSDPPRRSFLEEFIEFLSENKLLLKEHWDSDLERLSRRSETHNIQSSPSITLWGWIALFTLMVLPLGYRVFDAEKQWLSTQNILSLSIMSLPILALCANYICWRPWSRIFSKYFLREVFSKEFWTKHKYPYKERSIASLFINKTTDKVVNKIIKTPDPTAIEFRDLYKKVLGSIQNTEAKIIIVIDNLDRIPGDEAQTIWATIGTLFAESQLFPAIDQPWIIVPLDFGAAKAIFSDKNDQESDRAQAFIDKTFDIVFRLPNPILSDWQVYLENRLKEVFADTLLSDKVECVLRISNYAVEDSTSYLYGVTPRKINSFVNRMSAAIVEWGDEIPIQTLAYYIAFEKSIVEKNELNLLSKPAPIKNIIIDMDSDWMENLAALHYGIDKGKALQIYIVDKIKTAISENDGSIFKQCINIPGFKSIAERYVYELFLKKTSSSNFINLAYFLKEYSDGKNYSDIWALLKTGSLPIETWKSTPNDIAGIKILVENDHRLALYFISSLTDENVSSPEKWYYIVTGMLEFLNDDEVEKIADNFNVPGDVDYYLKIVSIACEKKFKNDHTLLAKKFKPANDIKNALLAKLPEQVQNNKFDRLQADIVLFLSQVEGLSVDFSPVGKRIESYVMEQNNSKSLNDVIVVCFAMGDAGYATLKKLCMEGYLYHYVYKLNAENLIKNNSLLFAGIMTANHENSLQQPYQNANNGVQLINQFQSSFGVHLKSIAQDIVELIPEECNADFFERMSIAAFHGETWKPLVREIINAGIRNNNFGKLYLDNVMSKMCNYLDMLDDNTGKQFVELLAAYGNFLGRFQVMDENGFVRVAQILYRNSKYKDKIIKLFMGKLAQQDINWWDRQFASRGNKYLLLLDEIIEDGHEVLLDDRFEQSIRKQIFSCLEHSSPESSENFSSLVYALSKTTQIVLVKDIFEKICDQTRDLKYAIWFLNWFGRILPNVNYLDNSEDKISRGIILRLLSNYDKKILESLLEHSSELNRAVELSTESSRNEIKRKLNGIVTNKDNDDTLKDIANKIVKQWAVIDRQ